VNEVSELAFDGERFVPGMAGVLELEHVHRYAMALHLAAGKQVLDLASGEGYGSNILATLAAHVIGVDISDEAVKHARRVYQRDNLEYRVGSCAAVPLEDGSVDLVVSFETIEHHDQHEQMLAEIARVLRPGGLLLISSPNKHEYSDVPHFANPFHVKELYLEEFERLLRHQFKEVEVFGQRTLLGSAIGRFERADNAPLEHRFVERHGSSEVGLARPIYFLALASNGPLPQLPNSLMEASSATAPAVRTILVKSGRLQLFWRRSNEGYEEERSAIGYYPVGAGARDYSVRITSDKTRADDSQVQELVALRLDIADEPLICTLFGLKITDGGQTLWQWDGDLEAIAQPADLVLLPNAAGPSAGVDFVCTGVDPHFELRLPVDVMKSLGADTALIARFSTQELLAPYQGEMLGHIAALRGELSRQQHDFAQAISRLQTQAEEWQRLLGAAQQRSLDGERELAQSRERELVALERTRRVEDALVRLHSHRWWPVLNRLFQLERP
jgi:SAM-dependent methyltransferase